MPGPWSHVSGHHRIEERDDNPYRLGRHRNHDPRSLAFQVPALGAVQSVAWPRRIGILDQGQLGSCTGNAAVGALGTDPIYKNLQPADGPLDEALAVNIYSDATKVDPYSGTYPPTDTGSDGLSVAKVCQTRGYISGYLHATSIAAMNTALMSGPVIVGTNWYDAMFTPDSQGFITVSGSLAGGHEYCIREYDVASDTYTADNSWGTGWGLAGRFKIHGKDMARLLAEGGDCTRFVPASEPPPQPDPDQLLWASVKVFATGRHYYPSTKATATALNAWAKAKGLT